LNGAKKGDRKAGSLDLLTSNRMNRLFLRAFHDET